MPLIDINKRVHEHHYSMSALHSHSHYEIYYLIKGNRLFFLKNKMYEISEPTLIIIPPHVMHKTEGEAFSRFNINVSPSQLNEFQIKTLEKLKLMIINPTPEEDRRITDILNETTNIKDVKNKSYIIEILFSYFIFLLSKIDRNTDDKSITANKPIPPTILKIISYMYKHYSENLTLDGIAEKFFVSKSTLNYSFKNSTSSTPMEYLLQIRLAKAKELLLGTKKSIQEISVECGFSSPNYFGLIFKKHELISPSTYRDNDR